ncbi:MAG: hypothetical protein ACRDPC_21525 [Solirubrobacteraceae bacterium]
MYLAAVEAAVAAPGRWVEILAAVEAAVAAPGRWVEIPRSFKTEFNASITGTCLQGGYLRVEPREGDRPIVVQGKRYIRTAAPVETRHRRVGDEWRLRIRLTS